MHVHPILFGPICEDKKKVEFRKQEFGLYKSSPIPMSQVMAVMDHAGVNKTVLLAEDYSTDTRLRANARRWMEQGHSLGMGLGFRPVKGNGCAEICADKKRTP